MLERINRRAPQLRLIFDDEHGLLPALGRQRHLLVRAGGAPPGGLVGDREIDAQPGAGSRRTVDLDEPTVLLYQTVHRCQPQPGSLPHRLGCEEGLEGALPRRLIHALPRVVDRQADVLRRRSRTEHVALCVADPGAAGLEPQYPTVRHRVARVVHEVEQDLLHRVAVGRNLGEVFVGKDEQLDVRRQHAP